jgi:hypothetical protein
VISQWLSGKTCVVSDSVCWNFWSEFLLASWSYGPNRLTGRYDRFDVTQLASAEDDDEVYNDHGHAWTFAYWNPAILRRTHLINPETGVDVPVTITLSGEQDIQVRNAPVPARHDHLQGPKVDIDLWYSTEGDWLALESVVEKGRRVRYVLH